MPKKIIIINRVLTVLLVLLSVIDVIILSLVWVTKYRYKLDFVECNVDRTFVVVNVGDKPSKLDVILYVNDRTNTNYRVSFDTSVSGAKTDILLSKTIYINPNLSIEEFTWSYVHEVMHNVWFTHNERFVEFETFKFLYETEHSFYRYCAYKVLAYMGSSKVDYDTRYYIYKYLDE